jgi:V-type H+-transporting ATPase subunit D
MGEVMREAAFSMAEVKFAMGEINSLVIQNVAKAQIKVRTKRDNVAGEQENDYLFAQLVSYI